jgi:hypothetical protein
VSRGGPVFGQTDLETDRITAMKTEYEERGAARSNLRYGYVLRARA